MTADSSDATTAGGKSRPWKIAWTSPVAPITLLVVIFVAILIFTGIHLVNLRRSRDLVVHTHQVIETTQQVFSMAQDVESGARGFILTGNKQFIDNFAPAAAEFPNAARRLRNLVADNSVQTGRVGQFVDALTLRVDFAADRVALAERGQLAAARDNRTLTGKLAMDRARRLMAVIMATENRMLAERTARSDHEEQIGFLIVLVVSVCAFAGLVSLIISMSASNHELVHEIAEREAAEVRQRESEALYRAIFAHAVDYIYVVDVTPDGRYLIAEFNPAFEKATGWTTEALRGVDLEAVSEHPAAATMVRRVKTLLAGEEPLVSREIIPMPSGERIWETVLTSVRNDQGRVERLVGAARDVTDRDRAEEQLRRAQRMEAVGHLTGGVAHDFNNLLQVIRGNLELLRPMLSGQEEALTRVRNAMHGADRGAQLTRQLLAFARRQPLEPKVVNLGRLVTDMTDMLRRTLGEGMDVETVIAGGLWNTLADPAQVESAILNLAINARDAMPTGGKLTVEVTNAVLDHNFAGRDADIEPGSYVLLAVSDTGQGMSAETLAQAFEPFFTTKSEEKGTGLGLSMVYGFVKQSRGHVQIYSEPDQGTTVKIYLPRAQRAEDRIAPTTKVSRGASEVILVVEDDDMVRTSAVGMLRDLGYACLHAADGAGALEILKQGAKVDLLFTDVIMPGPVKSRDLARQAELMRPGLPVLFTSGYTENAIVHQGRLDEGVQLLSKPYSRDDLARKVGGLIQAARPVVLVVEDDGLVRMSAVDMVESLGFRVLEAADAESALELLLSPARIDVLFTDIGLPGVRGPQLAQQARAQRPGLGIIFASGYGESEETAALTGAHHLAKPYEQDQLAEVLRTVQAV